MNEFLNQQIDADVIESAIKLIMHPISFECSLVENRVEVQLLGRFKKKFGEVGVKNKPIYFTNKNITYKEMFEALYDALIKNDTNFIASSTIDSLAKIIETTENNKNEFKANLNIRSNYLSELSFIDEMLEKIPESNAIDRVSFEGRRDIVKEKYYNFKNKIPNIFNNT